MKKKLGLIIVLIAISVLKTFGQEFSDIQGIVVDTNSFDPIPYATIQLLDSTNHLQCGAISDSDGAFLLYHVPQGNYWFQVSCVGYKKKRFQLVLNTRQQSFSVKMCPDTQLLGEVEVKGEAAKRSQQIDKSVFRIDEMVLSQSATALDALKNIPSLSVKMATEEIRVHGNPNVMVLIDGAYTKRSLSSLSPEDIESVEVITNPNAEFDSDVANVVNVVLKNDRKKGLRIIAMGRASYPLDYGFARVGVDYESAKSRVYANYHVSRSVIRPESSVFDSSYYSVDDGFGNHFEQYTSSTLMGKALSTSHLVQYGAEWRLSDKDLLNFTGNYAIANFSNTSLSSTMYWQNGIAEYKESDTVRHHSSEPEQNYSLFYRHKFNEKGHELSLNSNVYLMSGCYSNLFRSRFDYTDSGEINEVEMTRDLNNSQFSWNTKLKYQIPVGQCLNFSVGLQPYYRKVGYDMNDGASMQYFKYKDLRIAGFGQIVFQANEHLSMTAGLRAEYLTFGIYDTISRQQMNYLPNATLFYKINEKHSLSLRYNSYLTYPSYHYLSPFIYTQTDSLVFSSGNPNLLPEKAQKFGLKYTFQGDALYLELEPYYSVRSALIGEKRLIYSDITYLSYDNLASASKYGGNITAECDFSFAGLMAEVNFGYCQFEQSSFNGWEYQIAAGVMAGLPWKISLEATIEYMGKQRNFNGYNIGSPCIETVALSRSFLNNNLYVELAFENLFLTDKSETVIEGNGYFDREWNEYYNPMVNLMLRYVFKTGDRAVKEREDRESLMESEENAAKRK